ncbi:MAG: hypothetical protein IRZ28_17205, partial [Steroidobacteraceae bacterium]|nr:hypothetical protein [Steroidobacteraceae bacterium]
MANDEAPFGVSINLNQYELRNARVQNLASDPGSPVEGQVWWKTGTKRLAIYDGSTTRELLVSGTIKNNDIASDAAIAISKLAVDPRDRSTHTGTQTASTISDFNTAVRSNRLDQMAVPAANVSLNSKKITNLADPTSDTDAANKKYVDTSISNAVTGVRQQAISVFAASGENLNDSVGGLKIDASNLGDKLPGVSSEDLVEGETLILVKDQSSANKNGIYVVDEWDGANNRWNLIRADVMSTWDDVPGRLIIVESGGFEDTIWLSTADQGGTLETTPITFTQLPMDVETITAGNGLQKTGSTLAVKLDGSTLSASSSGLKIADGGIQALQLAANAVETAKIKDGNVTAAKLATDAVETAKIKDGNVTAAKLATDAVETAKIKDGNVTAAKLATDA